MKRYCLLFLLTSLFWTARGQTLGGYNLTDCLIEIYNHPTGCDASYITGFPDVLVHTNFPYQSKISGTFCQGWSSSDLEYEGLLLESMHNLSFYEVRLILSTGIYSAIHQVNTSDWSELPRVASNGFLVTNTGCAPHSDSTNSYIARLDFIQHFNLTPSDVVIGLEITFLGGPNPSNVFFPTNADFAGAYIIGQPKSISYAADTLHTYCYEEHIRIPLDSRVNCSNIGQDASEFRLYSPDGNLIQILSAQPDTCNAKNQTTSIDLVLFEPLRQNGYYYVVARKGLDDNTIGNRCGRFMAEFDTLVIAVSNCPLYQTPIQVVNVSVDSVNQNATYVQWTGPDTLNYSWFSNFLLWRRDNILNTSYQRVIYSEPNPAARYFLDVYPEILPRDSRIYYKVNLSLINLLRNPLSNELGTILLENNPPDEPEQLTLSMQWSPYEGWQNPLYFLQYKSNQEHIQEWQFPETTSGTIDTNMEFTKPIKPGKYHARIMTISPSNNYRSYSNWIPFEVPEREVKIFNVVTPNGDGINDRFYVENLEFYPGSKLQVFNRWGQEVFSQAAYNNDWEPRELEDGSFYYSLTLPEGRQLNGFFAVVK